MYKDEIKELYALKKDSKKIVIHNLVNLYIKLKIGYPNLDSVIIKKLINFYLSYDLDESEILKEINKRFGNIDYNCYIEDILDELDEIYNNYYNYIENIINNYELIIENNIINIIINRISGNYLKSNKYLLNIPEINKKLEKEKILKRIRSI